MAEGGGSGSRAIPPGLVERLQTALRLKRRAVYSNIEQIVNRYHVERRVAAILFASQNGINIARFASPDDLAAIRAITGAGTATKVSPLNVPAPSTAPRHQPRRRGSRARRQRGTSVWIVHGRNTKAANELRRFLRALGLQPLEWNDAVGRTRQGSPYIGEVLDRAFAAAAAVVVLLTPDDEGRLRALFRRTGEAAYEVALTPQARLNVIFEAGMAFGRNAASTVLVELGTVRPFSDVAGRHAVHLDNSPERRRELATKLANAGCNVDLTGVDWLSEGDFTFDGARRRTRPRPPRRRRRKARGR